MDYIGAIGKPAKKLPDTASLIFHKGALAMGERALFFCLRNNSK
jgi:hypothetical protein